MFVVANYHIYYRTIFKYSSAIILQIDLDVY